MGTNTCKKLIQTHTKSEKSDVFASVGQLTLVTFCSFGRDPKPCEARVFRLAAFLAAFLLLLDPFLLISPLSLHKLLRSSAAQLANLRPFNHAENPWNMLRWGVWDEAVVRCHASVIFCQGILCFGWGKLHTNWVAGSSMLWLWSLASFLHLVIAVELVIIMVAATCSLLASITGGQDCYFPLDSKELPGEASRNRKSQGTSADFSKHILRVYVNYININKGNLKI